MKIKYNFDLMLGVGWLAFWIGMAVSCVGQAPDKPVERYSYELPIWITILFGTTAVLFFLAGRKSVEATEKESERL